MYFAWRQKGAVVARARRRHRYQLADFQAGHGLPETGDVPGDLVAEDHRLLQPDSSEAAVIVVMKVRPADSPRRHADFNLARAGIPGRAVLDPKIPCRMNDDRFHRGLNERASRLVDRQSAQSGYRAPAYPWHSGSPRCLRRNAAEEKRC